MDGDGVAGTIGINSNGGEVGIGSDASTQLVRVHRISLGMNLRSARGVTFGGFFGAETGPCRERGFRF